MTPLFPFIETQTEGKVELVGMLRDQDLANSFTPPNNAEKGEWVFANIDEMAKHAGTEPVLVDEIFSANFIHCYAWVPFLIVPLILFDRQVDMLDKFQ